MKLVQEIFIQAHKYDWEDSYKIDVTTFKQESSSSVIVVDIEQREIEIELPDDFDSHFNQKSINELNERKSKVLAKCGIDVIKIEEQIQSLLAIDFKG
tara:strand:+ start:8003 stop:8296 length:294 start_codon:yes stop_codon:yes gene_type:complete